jgi:hypothetical protein
LPTGLDEHLPRLEEHAPRARCYKCGSTAVVDVCHHCGKAICRDDSPATQNILGRPRSYEFAGLGRRGDPGPVHCNTCLHVVRRRYLTFGAIAVAIVAIGIVVAAFVIIAGTSLIAAGAVLALYCYLADRREQGHPKQSPPPLPLEPNVDEIRVLETLNGKLTLDQKGDYTNLATSAHGELSISMALGSSDLHRLARYIRRYRLTDTNDVEFCAGFVLLRGPAQLKMDTEGDSSPVIPLTGRVREVPFLQRGRTRTTKQWSVERTYQPDLDYRPELKPERDGQPERAFPSRPQDYMIPISLTPAIVAESDQRALELELQWLQLSPPEPTFAIDSVESLNLQVPVSWGDVELVTRRAYAGISEGAKEGDAAVRMIELTRIRVEPAERNERRLRLSIKFEHKIEMDRTIRGRLQVNFKGTLSDLEEVDLYHPLGERRSGKFDASITTRVQAEFELSLHGIRYQEMRVVPDPDLDENELCDADEFDGVIPDYKTVIALTDAMSEDGYYVKRVIENPPRSGGRSNILNRYWDIAGRRYYGVFPIDFHIILTGEEEHAGDIRAYAGNMQARVTVQGAYATQKMAKRIKEQWESLHHLTLKELNSLRPALDELASEQRGETSPGPSRGHSRPEGVKYVRTLRTILGHLDDARARNQISDEAYWRVRTTIERELEEL